MCLRGAFGGWHSLHHKGRHSLSRGSYPLLPGSDPLLLRIHILAPLELLLGWPYGASRKSYLHRVWQVIIHKMPQLCEQPILGFIDSHSITQTSVLMLSLLLPAPPR